MKAIYQKKNRTPHTLRFDEASEQSLQEIHDMLCSRWRLTDKPSISLLLQGVIREYAEKVKDDPTALKGLLDEIKSRGGAIGRRNQFRLDGESLGERKSLEALDLALKDTPTTSV